MDYFPHEYLQCGNYTKEKIRITFFIENHLPYVKLSLRDDDEIRTCTERIMSYETLWDSIQCAEYKLLHGKP